MITVKIHMCYGIDLIWNIPDSYRRVTIEETVRAFMFDNGFKVDLGCGRYGIQWLHEHITDVKGY